MSPRIGRSMGRGIPGHGIPGRGIPGRGIPGRGIPGRCAAAAGALIVAALVLVPAAPASAASANIVISGPSPGQSFTSGVTSASVTITGNANLSQAPLERNVVTDLQVAVALGASTAYSCAHSAVCGATNAQPATSFSFTPDVTRNGPYRVTALVTGTECNAVLNSCVLRSSTATTNFNVGVRPAPPSNVRAQVNSDASVTVSWAANPEPDLVGYQIVRGGPGGSTTVNPFLRATTWTDTGTATTGGAFGYTVIAFRPGADGSFTSSTALSTSSAVATAQVPVPPAPSTTVGPVGQPVVSTTTTTAAPSPPTGPDLSAFLNQAAQAGAIPVAPAKVAAHATTPPNLVMPSVGASVTTPDTFVPNLPYHAPALAAPASATGGGGPQVPLAGRPLAAHHGRSLLYPIAGGMLLCVLGLWLRTSNRRAGPAPLEPVRGGDGGRPGGVRSSGGRPGDVRSTGVRSRGVRPGDGSVGEGLDTGTAMAAPGPVPSETAAGADVAGAVVGAGDPVTAPVSAMPAGDYFRLVRTNSPSG